MASKKNRPDVSTMNLEEELDRLNAMLKDNPEGFSDGAADLDGYWNFEKSPIFCIPQSARIMDGNIDTDKPAILFTVKLTKPCAINLPKEKGDTSDAQLAIAKAGAMVGIWFKPGLRALKNLGNQECKVAYTGEKNTGKPNPMKVFYVGYPKVGTVVPVVEDAREDSAHVPTIFDVKPSEARAAAINKRIKDQVADDTSFDPDELDAADADAGM